MLLVRTILRKPVQRTWASFGQISLSRNFAKTTDGKTKTKEAASKSTTTLQIADHDDEISASESKQYYDNRTKLIQDLKNSGDVRAPYPHKWPVDTSIENLVSEFEKKCSENGKYLDQTVTSAGRVTSIRKMGNNLFFFDMKSNGAQIQVICSVQTIGNQEDFNEIDNSISRGDIIGFRGQPGRSKRGEFSILADQIKLLAPCLHMLPQERTGIKDPEVRFRQKYLDLLINKGIREKFIVRNKVINYLRRYLNEKGFFEVETPILSEKAGGATARPFKTFHNDMKMDFTMRVAPELYLKNLIVGGFEKVYEIGKNFRNEGIDHNHNPEFTACEFYWAYADYNDVMDLTEDLLVKMVKDICGSTKIKLKSRHEDREVEIDFALPWKRISIIEELEKIVNKKFPEDLNSEEANKFLDELCQELHVHCSAPRTTARLIDKLVGHYIEPGCVNPTFLINHPQVMSPLAKPHRSIKGLTERFELFINQFEIVNSYTELNDPFIQKDTFLGQMQVEFDNLGQS
jgi:lysyl-tRNA synthetase class 2